MKQKELTETFMMISIFYDFKLKKTPLVCIVYTANISALQGLMAGWPTVKDETVSEAWDRSK